jgi:hypothetical protein
MTKLILFPARIKFSFATNNFSNQHNQQNPVHTVVSKVPAV